MKPNDLKFVSKRFIKEFQVSSFGFRILNLKLETRNQKLPPMQRATFADATDWCEIRFFRTFGDSARVITADLAS
ncbi:MAG TPA: hypothetical protein VH370_01110 [Humisphaera sp.]|nr:hypothetical protein [Humisphaera sp.]